MNRPSYSTDNNCRHRPIVAYIDGELSPREELELENHLAVCPACAEKLNDQKKILCALEFALEEEESEIELPENFTRVVVAAAESKVSGLRHPQERFRALFVCAALFLLVLLGLGEETSGVLTTFEKFFEQVMAVGGFAFHLVHDIAVGIAVVARSLCHRFIFNSAVSLVVLLIFFLLTTYAVSRLFVRQSRA
jgi:anti-sigma factor RsiW